jgi:hypothetical protein
MDKRYPIEDEKGEHIKKCKINTCLPEKKKAKSNNTKNIIHQNMKPWWSDSFQKNSEKSEAYSSNSEVYEEKSIALKLRPDTWDDILS